MICHAFFKIKRHVTCIESGVSYSIFVYKDITYKCCNLITLSLQRKEHCYGIFLGLLDFDSCSRIELLVNYESAAAHCMIKIFYRVVHHSILFHFLVDIGMPLCYRVEFERISYKLKEYSTHHHKISNFTYVNKDLSLVIECF